MLLHFIMTLPRISSNMISFYIAAKIFPNTLYSLIWKSCLNHSLLTKHPPSLIIEKVWFFSLDNDHIKKIPPVLANNELHAFVPKKDREIITMKCSKVHLPVQ